MVNKAREHQYIIKDFTLISHTGLEVNIWPQVIEFNYQEAIFNKTIHGTISLVEAIDFPTILPLIGEERIKISFTRIDEETGTELDPIKIDAPIYCLKGKMQDGDSGKRQTYTLAFCSDSLFNNLNSVVSKAFKSMPYSEMVKEIYETYLKASDKPIEVEDTDGIKNYTVQNQRAIKSILNICERSKSSSQDNGNFFVFYEDRDKFNFYTMRGLLNKGMQEGVRRIYYGIKNLPNKGAGPGDAFKDLSKTMYMAEIVEEKDSGFDILDSAQRGEGASSILTVDPIRRNFSFKTLDLRGDSARQQIEKSINSPAELEFLPNSDFSSIVGASGKKPWTENSKLFVNPRAKMRVVIGDSGQDTQEYIAARDPQVRPEAPEEFAMQKLAEKRQFFRRPLITSIPGDPRMKPGSVIYLVYPEKIGNISSKKPQELDKYLQGHYLVVGVSHIITKEKYNTSLELMRPSDHSEIIPRDPFQIFGHRDDDKSEPE